MSVERLAVAFTKFVDPLRQAQDSLRQAQGERKKQSRWEKPVRAELIEARTQWSSSIETLYYSNPNSSFRVLASFEVAAFSRLAI
jgi:hypothetical protein